MWRSGFAHRPPVHTRRTFLIHGGQSLRGSAVPSRHSQPFQQLVFPSRSVSQCWSELDGSSSLPFLSLPFSPPAAHTVGLFLFVHLHSNLSHSVWILTNINVHKPDCILSNRVILFWKLNDFHFENMPDFVLFLRVTSLVALRSCSKRHRQLTRPPDVSWEPGQTFVNAMKKNIDTLEKWKYSMGRVLV